jgi:N-methylhydantoinase A
VLAVVTAKLAGAIKLSLFERGLDPRDFALMSFGGAGGLHAIAVAEELGMRRVVFPQGPSTFSAHGILQSDIVHDLSHAGLTPLVAASLAEINRAIAELRAEGMALLAADGMPPERCLVRFEADLRYRGQAFELLTPLPKGSFGPQELERLQDAFHRLHEERFSFDDRSETIEMVTLRASAIGMLEKIAPDRERVRIDAQANTGRSVFLDGRWQEVPVHRQESVAAGAGIAGPAIIEQALTSFLLPAGWHVGAAPTGDLIAVQEAP